ncbi:MAG: metal-sulfur cluster assembly factor [Myxococcota bacterium]|jgi:metal-sulfur cluster biosynthetic enzyme
MQEEFATETDTQAIEAPQAETTQNAGAASTDVAGSSTKDAILEALKNVIDPELGLNIVDLGLVYDVQLDAQGDVDIQYSLTTMGCPIGPMIEDQMRGFLRGVPGVGEVRPEFVIRPPWTPEMMSDEAKASLGIF